MDSMIATPVMEIRWIEKKCLVKKGSTQNILCDDILTHEFDSSNSNVFCWSTYLKLIK